MLSSADEHAQTSVPRTWRPPLPSALRGPRRCRGSTPGCSSWTHGHPPPATVFPGARHGRSLSRCGEITFRALTRYRAPNLEPNDLQLWELLEGCEVEPGLGQEALEEAGPVLHPPEPGLDQRGQLIDVVLDQVGQRPFQVRPDRLDRVQLRRVQPAAGRPSATCGRRSARASRGWCGCSGRPRPARAGRPAAGARRPGTGRSPSR